MDCLALAGYEIYQPLLREQRRSHGRKITVTPPTGYLFLWVVSGWWNARWAAGVRRLVMDGLLPARVPERVFCCGALGLLWPFFDRVFCVTLSRLFGRRFFGDADQLRRIGPCAWAIFDHTACERDRVGFVDGKGFSAFDLSTIAGLKHYYRTVTLNKLNPLPHRLWLI